jgi:hypothetical protein
MKKRKIKAIVMLLIGIATFVFLCSRLDIKSVKQYKGEQKKLQELVKSEDYTKIDKDVELSDVDETDNVEDAVDTKQKEDSENTDKDNSKNEKNRKDENVGKKNQQQTDVPTTDQKSDLSVDKKENQKKNKSDKSNNKSTKKPKSTKTPTKEEKKTFLCKITIDCSVLLDNMDAVDENMKDYIPQSGYLVKDVEMEVEDGETAYDCLQKVCQAKDIALDANFTPLYNSYYVRGIGYLYEKMAGRMSGWLYQVNGVVPNVGASGYKLKSGDQINWVYTCSGRIGS